MNLERGLLLDMKDRCVKLKPAESGADHLQQAKDHDLRYFHMHFFRVDVTFVVHCTVLEST